MLKKIKTYQLSINLIKHQIKVVLRGLIPPFITNIFKTLYKKENYYLNRLKSIKRHNSGATRILGKKVLFTDSKSFVSQFYEIFKEKNYLFRTENEEPTIIDCGSNIGLSIIFFKKYYPKSKIIGFEPDQEIFKVLKLNINNSGFHDVKLINSAVWNKNSYINFVSEGSDSGKIDYNRKSKIKVKTERLKDYLKESVDFLKVDIEGAEYDVIKDCEAELNNVKNLFIEYHQYLNNKQRLHDILEILEKLNFEYHINSAGVSSNSPLFLKKIYSSNLINTVNIFASKDFTHEK